MDKKQPLIPLCRLYQNESQRTGKSYLLGSLTFTTKIVGFQAEDDQGNACWQLYIQERPPKGAAGQQRATPAPTAEKPLRMAEQPVSGDFGGIDGGDYPVRGRTA